MGCFPGCCSELLCRVVNLFVTQFTSQVASSAFGCNGESCCRVYIEVDRLPPAHPLYLISTSYNNGKELQKLWECVADSSRQTSSLCLNFGVILEGYRGYQAVAYRRGGEGFGWGVQFPPPPKFRSFGKAEPNSQFRGKYVRNNLIRIRVSFIWKLSGTPD
jgi:hypothetical protein